MIRTWVGDAGEGQVGTTITCAGWVHRVRNHGGIVFFDLRDRTGLLQVVVTPESPAFGLAERLHPEYVVQVSGELRLRPPAFVNPRLATGTVELAASALAVLNAAEPPPIRGADEGEMDETLRLRYRYLDLRRPAMAAHVVARHRLAQATRRFLDEAGFLEVETPMLTRSTPEGARDFLVPARLMPGSFYALPQSPQLFKQLLMVAGMERYFQIVRCFRDEDLRADRQPEFTQIDIEMSFIDQDDVLKVTEELVAHVYRTVGGWDVAAPFPRLTYEEAMARYGSDKPDLRYGLELVDVADLVAGGEIPFLAAAHARGDAVLALATGPQDLTRREIEGLGEGLVGDGLRLAWAVREADGFRGGLASHLRGAVGDTWAAKLALEPGGLLLVAHGPRERLQPALGSIRQRLAARLQLVPTGRHAFLWVTGFPLFEWSETEGRIVSVHHPFTSPRDEDLEHLRSDPLKVRAKAYDLVLDGYELGGGSIRIHRADVQAAVFEVLGLRPDEVEEKFGFLLEAFRYGAPPHGGIALGFDRMVMLLEGAPNLREVIAFPKAARGNDPLTGAPAAVRPEQLEELGLSLSGPPSG
jgi:aspartyl-tRNA synthetase